MVELVQYLPEIIKGKKEQVEHFKIIHFTTTQNFCVPIWSFDKLTMDTLKGDSRSI